MAENGFNILFFLRETSLNLKLYCFGKRHFYPFQAVILCDPVWKHSVVDLPLNLIQLSRKLVHFAGTTWESSSELCLPAAARLRYITGYIYCNTLVLWTLQYYITE